MDEAAAEQFAEASSRDHIFGELESQIRALEQRLDVARGELESASDAVSEELTAEILRLESMRATSESDRELIAAFEDPPLTDPQVLGWEVTQGLVEYELVAGKDTLVRVFVRAREVFQEADARLAIPASFHIADPYEVISRLDYASLEVTAPNGTRFRVPATMSGTFSFPSMSEDDNVNFYIDGDQLSRPGRYAFVARFYRDGLLVGTNPLGNGDFLETGDFRLLIKVNTWPMSAAGWDTVLESLEYLQRNLPVRAGVAPMDSDTSAGVRYFIDPRPYEPGWNQTPKWMNAKLALSFFNLTQHPFGSGDRAHMLMNVREQQPTRPYEPGAAEGPENGGPGRICGVQRRMYPTGDAFFATVVSQEIGHNLIPLGSHAQTEAMATASAFDMLNRATLPEVHNVMFQTVRDGSTNEMRLFEPSHWAKMRNTLIQLNA